MLECHFCKSYLEILLKRNTTCINVGPTIMTMFAINTCRPTMYYTGIPGHINQAFKNGKINKQTNKTKRKNARACTVKLVLLQRRKTYDSGVYGSISIHKIIYNIHLRSGSSD